MEETTRVLISDFTMGQLSDRFAGRLDTELRVHAVETILGFVLHPDGGLRRRPGTVWVRDGLGITPATDRLYDSAGIPGFVVYKDDSDTWLGWCSSDSAYYLADNLTNTSSMTITDTTSSLDAGTELWTEGLFVDPVDSVEYLHVYGPTDDVRISLTSDTITRPTNYDLGLVYEGRYIAIERDTGDVSMSMVEEYTDFSTDDALNIGLSGIPPFAGAETPKWIKARQSVYLGTDKGEYQVYSNFGFFSEEPGGMMIDRVSDMGSAGAAFFGPNMVLWSEKRIIGMSWSGSELNYEMGSLTEGQDNAEWLTAETVEYGARRYLMALDRDGDLYAYLQSPGTQVQGWVKIREDVGWFTVYDKDVYVAYEKASAYRVDVFPLDSLRFPGDRTAREHQMFDFCDIHGEGGGYITCSSVVYGDVLPGSATMAVWEISNSAESAYAGAMATSSDGSLPSSTLKTLTGYGSDTQYLYCYESGQTPDGKIETLPISLLLGGKHKISKVILQVWKSRGAKVRINDGTWEEQTSTDTYSGPWEFRVSHTHTEEPRIEIQPLSDMPLNVYQILADVSVGEV